MPKSELFIENKLLDPLPKDAIYDYLQKAHSGNKEARNLVIKHNIKLVLYIVNSKFSNSISDEQDLVSTGIIGLIKAVDTFDISKNCQFVTYASTCISNEIIKSLNKNKKYIWETSFNEIISVDKNDKELTIEDVISDTSPDLISRFDDLDYYRVVRSIVESLPEMDKKIIKLYFGFIDGRPYNQTEISVEVNMSQSNICRRMKNILENLKRKIEMIDHIKNANSNTKTNKKPN